MFNGSKETIRWKDNLVFYNIVEAITKRELTDNGLIRIKKLILSKIKLLSGKYWSILEQEIKQFFKNYWIFIYQPETITKNKSNY